MPDTFATVAPLMGESRFVLGKLGGVVEVSSYAGTVMLETTNGYSAMNPKEARVLMAHIAKAVVEAERMELAEGPQDSRSVLSRWRGQTR